MSLSSPPSEARAQPRPICANNFPTQFCNVTRGLPAFRKVSPDCWKTPPSSQTSSAIQSTALFHFPVPQLCQSIEDHQIAFLVGEAGSGKSAVAKDAFSLVTQRSLGFAFRAESLAGNHINDVLRRFGLTLEGLRSQTALQGRKLLWIDGLERLLEKPSALRLAFLDLLRGLKVDPTWRFLITCRNYSADTVKNAFFGEVGIKSQDLTVGDFDDAELPANEREFRKKVWNEVVKKNDEGQSEGIPARRGQVMVSVALRRARAMEPYVVGASEDPGILH
jgi:hypothetical protein